MLVNNAGMMQEAGVEAMSREEWERTLRVNLTAPFLFIKAALPHLRAARGSIVNIGSIEGLGSNPLHAAYSASKAGLHGLTRAVAVDYSTEVRCNAVAPGWTVSGSSAPSGFQLDGFWNAQGMRSSMRDAGWRLAMAVRVSRR